MHIKGSPTAYLRPAFSFAILFMVAIAVFPSVGCTTENDIEKTEQSRAAKERKEHETESVEEEWKHIETVRFDWDGDNESEEFLLEVEKDWDGGGYFTRLIIRKSGQEPFVLKSVEDWDKYKDEVTERVVALNIVKSEYLLFIRISKDEKRAPLLFVLGYAYGSSPGSLDILSIEGGLPHSIFSEEYFSLGNVKDIDGDGLAEIMGFPCYGEFIGNNYYAYIPYQIFQLPNRLGKAVLSLELSEKYNREHYYGWAGPNCSYDFVVVEKPPDGGPPRIMSKVDADKLFERKP